MNSGWIFIGLLALSCLLAIGGLFAKWTRENKNPKDDRAGKIVQYWVDFGKFIMKVITGKIK